jgi:DNA replication protein DnaC
MAEVVSAGGPLFGRESELDVLDRLLDDIHGRGGSLAVTGGAGVGKSALLVETASRAASRGCSCCGPLGFNRRPR